MVKFNKNRLVIFGTFYLRTCCLFNAVLYLLVRQWDTSWEKGRLSRGLKDVAGRDLWLLRAEGAVNMISGYHKTLSRQRGKVNFYIVWVVHTNLSPFNDIEERNPFICLICQLKAKQNTPHDTYRLGFRQLAGMSPLWWITAIDLMSFNAAYKQHKSAQLKPSKPLGNPQVFAVLLLACNNDGQVLSGSPVQGQIRKDLHSA